MRARCPNRAIGPPANKVGANGPKTVGKSLHGWSVTLQWVGCARSAGGVFGCFGMGLRDGGGEGGGRVMGGSWEVVEDWCN